MPKTTAHRDREKYLVARLAKKIPSIGSFGRGSVRLGIGDDSAVLRPSAKSEFVVSCDFSLEGVHFRNATHPAVSIGYRCLARATSDIAAMGARPRYFLLALALPVEKTLPASAGSSVPKRANWFDSFASGLGRAARELGMLLIGGDITVSPSVSVCVTVIGELPARLAIGRSGARPGDLIYVTGTLGAAHLGLELLLRGSAAKSTPAKLLQPHLYPRIPIAFAQGLARRRIPSAMMDISDGLSTDLARLCQSSRTGARLFAAKLPCLSLSESALRRLLNCHSEPMRPVSSEESAFTQRDVNTTRHATIHCHPERSEGSASLQRDVDTSHQQKGEPARRSLSGHGFSRAETSAGMRLQPLRNVLDRPHMDSSASDATTPSSNDALALDSLQLALHGGEDYALLFTVPLKRAPLLRSIAAKTKTRITHIGEITRSRKILLIDSTGHASPLEPRGWDPFLTDEP